MNELKEVQEIQLKKRKKEVNKSGKRKRRNSVITKALTLTLATEMLHGILFYGELSRIMLEKYFIYVYWRDKLELRKN